MNQELEEYIELVVAQEKKHFQEGGVELFSEHADKIRHQLRLVLQDFYNSYYRGYKALCDELHTKPKEISLETLKNFYQVAHTFLNEKQYEKARDAFYCLVAIAPSFSPFWLALAISYAHLNELELSLSASLQAIELDPRNADGYVNCLYVYRRLQDHEKALRLCEQGLQFAQEHEEEPWAQKLKNRLEKVRGSYESTTL